MVEKDNYATTSPLNEGASANNSIPNAGYMNSPFGNVKVYDLDSEIAPIDRMQVLANAQNDFKKSLPTTIAVSEVAEDVSIQESKPAIVSKKDNLPLKLAVIAGTGVLAYYTLYKMLKK